MLFRSEVRQYGTSISSSRPADTGRLDSGIEIASGSSGSNVGALRGTLSPLCNCEQNVEAAAEVQDTGRTSNAADLSGRRPTQKTIMIGDSEPSENFNPGRVSTRTWDNYGLQSPRACVGK